MTYQPRTARPHLWKSGPDPEQHRLYKAWLQQRNQARWRGETWHLTFKEWIEVWGDLIDQRGRTRDSYCLTRQNYDRDWTRDNVIVLPRRAHNNQQRRQKWLRLNQDAQ